MVGGGEVEGGQLILVGRLIYMMSWRFGERYANNKNTYYGKARRIVS